MHQGFKFVSTESNFSIHFDVYVEMMKLDLRRFQEVSDHTGSWKTVHNSSFADRWKKYTIRNIVKNYP